MKSALLILPLLSFTGAALAQNETAAEEQPPVKTEDKTVPDDMPQWMVGFTNLPEKERIKYLTLFQQAKDDFFARNWFSCLEKLDNAEQIYQGNPHIHTLRGSCYMEIGSYDTALAEYNKVEAIQPDDLTNKANIATLAMLQGKYENSIKLFREILDALPGDSNPELLNVLKFKIYASLVKMGKDQEAAKYAAEADILEDSPRFYFMEAVRYLQDKNMSKGIQSIRTAEKIFGSTPIFQTYLRIVEQMKFLPTGI